MNNNKAELQNLQIQKTNQRKVSTRIEHSRN